MRWVLAAVIAAALAIGWFLYRVYGPVTIAGPWDEPWGDL